VFGFFLRTIALKLPIEGLIICRFKGIAETGMISNEVMGVGGENQLPTESGFVGPT
jgi:hypothetical protein